MAVNEGCWARSLGDCKGRLSGEHLLSAGMFRSTQGKPNTRRARMSEEIAVTHREPGGATSTKDLTVRRYTAHILCEYHNNTTSELDAAGGELIDAIWGVLDTHDARAPNPKLPWNPRRYVVKRELIERWLMKIAVNNAFGGLLPIGGHAAQPGWPTSELVEMIFGRRPIPNSEGGGLFQVLHDGPTPDRPAHFDLGLIERTGVLAAGLLLHRSFILGANLTNSPIAAEALCMLYPWLRSPVIVQLKSMRLPETNVELVFASSGRRN